MSILTASGEARASIKRACPFCGEIDRLEFDETDVDWCIYCPECMTYGPRAKGPDAAVEKWDTRE